MSMTVRIATCCTELETLQQALKELGIEVRQGRSRGRAGRLAGSEFLAEIRGREVGFARDRKGVYEMVGDSEWSAMGDRELIDQIQQRYALVSVKKKAKRLGYRVANVKTNADGSLTVVARAWS